MSMDCKTIAELATRVVSGNASLEDAAQLRSHVAACASCADLERRLVRTWGLMGELPALVSRSPVPAAPRKLVSPVWMVGAAAAALLVVSALSFSLWRPAPKAGPSTPVASQTAPEEARPEQHDEENRVQNVLTQIDIENHAAPAPVVVPPPAPPVQDSLPVVQTPAPAPKAPESAAPERKAEVVKTPPAPTRTEEKAAPAAPPAAAEAVIPVIATLDRVEGDVFAMSAGKRVPVQSGYKLVSGDALETSGKTGQAVVEFPDGTRLVLGAETIVDSIRIAEGKRVSLKQGVLAAQISKQPAGEPMIFLTATAESRVVGTRLTLSATAASTRLEVREGKVRATRKDDGAAVDVGAGQFLQIAKGLSMTPKPVTTLHVALHETFDGPRWNGIWRQGGDANVGIKMAIESGSLSAKALQKIPQQDVTSTKLPADAADIARKVQGASALSSLAKKDWPRAGWLETRQAFAFSNETPLRIRTRVWNSHNDPDRISWCALNRGVSGQGLVLERRGPALQLWVDGANAALWKKDIAAVQEWETLELWLSKDQMIVRRNEETLYVGLNPLKVKGGTLSLGVHAKLELAQDEEARFDDVDVLLTTRAEFDEVSR
jgi:ferric-dicitrate binding protein FerR (iron transport regulator)